MSNTMDYFEATFQFSNLATNELCIKYFDIEYEINKIKRETTCRLDKLELQKMIIISEIEKRKSQENVPME